MNYISQGKSGSWYLKVIDEYHGEKTEAYIQISFKRGAEPLPEDLNEYKSLDGDFYFIHDGKRRKVFPGCYRRKDGSVGYKMILLEEEIEQEEERGGLQIDASDVPFY